MNKISSSSKNRVFLHFFGAFFCCALILSACFEPKKGCLDIAATNFDASADEDCCCVYPNLRLKVVQRFGDVAYVQNGKYKGPVDSFVLNNVVFYLCEFQVYQGGKPLFVTDTLTLPTLAANDRDTLNKRYRDDFLLVRRESTDNTVGGFGQTGTFDRVRVRLGIADTSQRVLPNRAPTGHPLRTQPDKLWIGRDQGYALMQVVLTKDTKPATPPDTIRLSRADFPAGFFLDQNGRFARQTGYDLEVLLTCDYKKMMDGIDLTKGDKTIWKNRIVVNLTKTFSISQ
jgi:hypothetical protein